MSDKRLKATLRDEIGTNKVKKIRVEKIVPGIVYNKGEETRHIAVDSLEFIKVFKKVGTSSLMELEIDGEIIPSIVKSVQRHPVKGNVIHIDFQKLDMLQKLKIHVPISLLHRDKILLQPSVLMQMLDSIEIECLPGDIPESVGIDVSGMDFSTPLYVKDLEIMKEEKVHVISDPEAIICSLNEPAIVEEDEEVDEAVEPAIVGEEEEEE